MIISNRWKDIILKKRLNSGIHSTLMCCLRLLSKHNKIILYSLIVNLTRLKCVYKCLIWTWIRNANCNFSSQIKSINCISIIVDHYNSASDGWRCHSKHPKQNTEDMETFKSSPVNDHWHPYQWVADWSRYQVSRWSQHPPAKQSGQSKDTHPLVMRQ